METQINRIYQTEIFDVVLTDGRKFQFCMGRAVGNRPCEGAVDSIVWTNAPADKTFDIEPGTVEWDKLCEAFWDAHAALIEKEWVKPS